MIKTEQSNNSITWKLYEVSITAPDGINLKGLIRYWAKDYSVCMTHPFYSQDCNGHLQYAIPAVYATTEADRKGVYMYRLINLAKENLLELYRSEVKEC